MSENSKFGKATTFIFSSKMNENGQFSFIWKFVSVKFWRPFIWNFFSEKKGSLEALIKIYQDKDQILSVGGGPNDYSIDETLKYVKESIVNNIK